MPYRYGKHDRHEPKTEAEALATAWTGRFTILNAVPAAGNSVTMSPTPGGSMAFTAQQTGSGNNQGVIQLGSGGSSTQVPAPPGAQQPTAQVTNFSGDALTVTNISPGAGGVPQIIIQALGPGIPGVTTANLPNDGSLITIQPFGAATGKTLTRTMTLRMTCTSGLAVVVVIGGPASGSPPNNGYVFLLNAQNDAGVPSGGPWAGPVAGDYYATCSNNQYDFATWPSSFSIFAGNMSQSTAAVNLQLF